MRETLERLFCERVPVLVQGISGRAGSQHALAMRAYGTNVVAGVGSKAGDLHGIPVFTDCARAVATGGALASVVMVPPLSVKQAAIEAIDAGVKLIVVVAEGVPVHDTLAAVRHARERGAMLVGPSTAGLAVPGKAKLGFLPDVALRPGPLGVISKSGTLAYELCWRLASQRIGQSMWVGVGGDPVKGTRFADLVPVFAANDDTHGLLVIGEIGGTEEEELAQVLISTRFAKPVFAVLAGASAPEGVTMGHAGAMIAGDRGTIASKTQALRGAGAEVFDTMQALVETVAARLPAGSVRTDMRGGR